ncbi:MAG: hypothetical protein GX879_01155, partial [Bacteroidales bacterium]|nr:hypothetical protein [Bacteroidales bacterium]
YSTSYNTAGSGFVNVNSINDEAKTISGTFGFKAYREHDGTYKSISEGRFSNVPFKYISTVDTSSFDNYMHAIINDQAWSALTVNAVKNDTAIIITGNNSENWEKLKIIIPNNIGAGVQTITASGPVFTIFEQGFHTYHGSAGSVTIAEHNQETQIIKASFFFNFVNEGGVTISITSGQFEALYIDETEN